MVVMSFGNQLTPGQPTARYQEPQAESCELVRHPGILLEVEGRDGRDVTASNTLEGAWSRNDCFIANLSIHSNC